MRLQTRHERADRAPVFSWHGPAISRVSVSLDFVPDHRNDRVMYPVQNAYNGICPATTMADTFGTEHLGPDCDTVVTVTKVVHIVELRAAVLAIW